MSEQAAGYKIELDVFEGPLDLLLHLVKKHELDILDIPIAFITDKYLAYLDMMKALNLDVAGEYLLMAATLAHIKSRELLPTPDPIAEDELEEGEEADPRAELVRRLLEYQKYKEAAAALGDRPVMGKNVWTRGQSQAEVAADVDAKAAAPLAELPAVKLIEAFDRLMARAKVSIKHEVAVERVSVADRIAELATRLETEGAFSFASCFGMAAGEGDATLGVSKHEAVVTLLAILELCKLGILGVAQADGEDDIVITRAAENVRERLVEHATDDEYR